MNKQKLVQITKVNDIEAFLNNADMSKSNVLNIKISAETHKAIDDEIARIESNLDCRPSIRYEDLQSNTEVRELNVLQSETMITIERSDNLDEFNL